MAEILIRIVDKTNADPVLNREASKAGDIIHVAPDGWSWGTAELVNPDWRIVKIPGYDHTLLLDMIYPDVLTRTDGSQKVLRKRKKWLDFALDPTVRTFLRTSAQVITVNASMHNKINAIRATKPAMDVVVVG